MTNEEMNSHMAVYAETNGVEKILKLLVNHLCIVCRETGAEFEAQAHGYTVEVREGE